VIPGAAGGMVPAEAALARLEPTIRAVVGEFRVPGYDREDLVQEARLHILANLASFDPERGRSGHQWARTLVRRRLIDIKRAQRRRLQPTLFEQIADALQRTAAREPRLIVEFGRACTPLQMETLRRLAQGLSLGEIARERGVSKQAVHRVVVRVRRKAVLSCVE